MLKAVAALADFDVVSAMRCQDDADYKQYYLNSTGAKLLNCDCNIAHETASELAKELSCHLILTPRPMAFKDMSNLMGIVSGESFADINACVVTFLQNGVTSLAVPYDICSLKGDTTEVMSLRRVMAVSLIPAEVAVHLLGFVALSEFWWYKGRKNMSLNTGIPILLGLRDMDILEPLPSKGPSTLEMFKTVPADKAKWGQVCRNVAILRKYL